MVAWAEARGFDDAPVNGAFGAVRRPSVRNNSRVMVDDSAFAQALWGRLEPHQQFVRDVGLMPLGLNERLRLYRYDVGMFFEPHTDGAYRRSDGSATSLLSVMVYLNGDFERGETWFPDLGRGVVPETGLGAVFWHRQLHEGRAVQRGGKYALRTDVMVGRAAPGPPRTRS